MAFEVDAIGWAALSEIHSSNGSDPVHPDLFIANRDVTLPHALTPIMSGYVMTAVTSGTQLTRTRLSNTCCTEALHPAV